MFLLKFNTIWKRYNINMIQFHGLTHPTDKHNKFLSFFFFFFSFFFNSEFLHFLGISRLLGWLDLIRDTKDCLYWKTHDESLSIS